MFIQRLHEPTVAETVELNRVVCHRRNASLLGNQAAVLRFPAQCTGIVYKTVQKQ